MSTVNKRTQFHLIYGNRVSIPLGKALNGYFKRFEEAGANRVSVGSSAPDHESLLKEIEELAEVDFA